MPRWRPARWSAVGTFSCVAILAAGCVTLVDLVLQARVRSGADNALRLSVILPYVGVSSAYVLARACGIVALVFSGASVGLGLDIGRRRRGAGRPAGLIGMVQLHRQTSLVALALVLAHIVVPYTARVPPFGGWGTALVPFGQPYSFGVGAKIYESFGIVAFYLLLLFGPTYYVLRRRRWMWSALHSLTVGAYALAVVHALLLGTDFLVRGPARTALLAVQCPLTLLLARRLFAGQPKRAQRLAAFGATLLSAAIAAAAAASLAGASLGARQI